MISCIVCGADKDFDELHLFEDELTCSECIVMLGEPDEKIW